MARKNIKRQGRGAKKRPIAKAFGRQKEKANLAPAMASGKSLSRSASNRVLLGVMGGIAEYFNADPMHVRMVWWAFIIIAGLAAGAVAYAFVPTLLTLLGAAYLIAYLLMNETPAKGA